MTTEPELSPEVAGAKGLRTGWTTGTCASAAAKAATQGLVSGKPVDRVTVELPGGATVEFAVADTDAHDPGVAAIVKDAGDDPDCTDGAHVTARIEWLDTGEPNEVELLGGDGVGTITQPGLGLEVGSPAINPVPERMIRRAIAEITDRPLRCTISVPGGRAMAEKTSNGRLGILGGISILGTTGVVKPFSTASYRASVVQQIDVAAAQQRHAVVLATGSRSDEWAQTRWTDYLPVQFIEVGDFTGIALRRVAGVGIKRVHFVGMAGKITKLAAGVMMTHFHRSKVDTDLLHAVATETAAPTEVIRAATETNTARHFFEVCLRHDTVAPLQRLCERASVNCRSHAGGDIEVEVIMIDFAGEREICRG